MTADQEAVEAVSEILSRVAPGGVSVELPFELVDEGLGARTDHSRPAIVRAYVPALDASAAKVAVEQAERALGHLQAFGLRPIGELQVRPVHEEDWADAWKRHFPVLRIGRRLVIRPTWRRHRASPDDVVLALDPGMAFGTGLHPTTRLCLAAIERWADEGHLTGARVLDVGCGSGVLSLAAAKLGAVEVLGVDTDPIAAEATLANARRNRLVRKVHARRGTLPVSESPFDVLLANLIASVLVHLAGELAAALRPGGRLLASGIFRDREDEVRAAFDEVGLSVIGRTDETDWVCLEVVRSTGVDRGLRSNGPGRALSLAAGDACPAGHLASCRCMKSRIRPLRSSTPTHADTLARTATGTSLTTTRESARHLAPRASPRRLRTTLAVARGAEGALAP